MKLAFPRDPFVQFTGVSDVIFQTRRRARVISQSPRKFRGAHTAREAGYIRPLGRG
jgi:hypothetical protein